MACGHASGLADLTLEREGRWGAMVVLRRSRVATCLVFAGLSLALWSVAAAPRQLQQLLEEYSIGEVAEVLRGEGVTTVDDLARFGEDSEKFESKCVF